MENVWRIEKDWTKKPKKMRDVEVVAWFTPEIPVSSGPSWYQGLPGLILEVSDDDTLHFKMKKEQKDLKCGDNQGKEDNHRLQDFDK